MKSDSKGRGGARPGSGRPKGSYSPQTIEREEALKQFRERVAKNVNKLFNTQMDLAQGEKYLFVVRDIGSGAKRRRETTMIEDPEIIKQYLDGELDGTDDEYYYMTTKAANNMAIDSMLNRTFGKPEQSIDLTSGGEQIANVALVEFKKSDDNKKNKS